MLHHGAGPLLIRLPGLHAIQYPLGGVDISL